MSEELGMYAVRIDYTPDEHEPRYVFAVKGPTAGVLELVALDSTPGVIAFVRAPNPGAAAARAWEIGKAELEALTALGGMKALTGGEGCASVSSRTSSNREGLAEFLVELAQSVTK